MNLVVVGTNHKYSPIEKREKIAFSKRSLERSLSFLKETTGISSAVILSTCNRVEIYGSSKTAGDGLDALAGFLSVYHEIKRPEIEPYLYKYSGFEAVGHLLKVATGLDSQVLGEEQILGQARQAYEKAKQAGFTDGVIDHIFGTALDMAKSVRSRTRISKNGASIGHAAAALIKRESKKLRGKSVLIIGIGKISEIVAKALAEESVYTVLVSNRTYEKAQSVAKSVGARAVRFDNVMDEVKRADIIVSATSSPHTILRERDLTGITHPVLVIDLAVPRDVDPGVRRIEGVRLFDLDGLKYVIEDMSKASTAEAEEAGRIVETEAKELWEKFIRSGREEALSR